MNHDVRHLPHSTAAAVYVRAVPFIRRVNIMIETVTDVPRSTLCFHQGTSDEVHHDGPARDFLPQRCNSIAGSEVERLLSDDAWWMQQKFDGRRLLLRRHGQQVSGINCRGLVLDALPEPLVVAVRKLAAEDVLLDGEAIGGARFVAFDLLSVGDQDLRSRAYFKRYEQLLDLVDAVDADELRFAPVASNHRQKAAMLARLQDAGAEGVVFKRSASTYTSARPASGGDWLKLKFVATANCIVAGDTH
jgi:bifunctional non-homologous end joining protein LigD